MAGNVGEQQAADTPGSATREVIDISAARGLAEWFAVDPHVESRKFDTPGGELATSPDLHAPHLLRGGIRHGAIITVESEFNRFDAGCPVRHFARRTTFVAQSFLAIGRALDWKVIMKTLFIALRSAFFGTGFVLLFPLWNSPLATRHFLAHSAFHERKINARFAHFCTTS